ncbi:MAG: Uma2 family endonuclease [Myxococcota bacterium]|nr:Uma2 family endonuclease [Myxococcota bacterium]
MVNAAIVDGRLEPMSIEQWAALPANEPGEIVDGYLVEEEVPENVHELVVAWFIGVFRGWGSAIGAIVLGSGAKYAVAQTRGRMPDVSMFLPGNPRPPRRGLNRHPPSLIVEVVSETARDARRDRVEKLREYAAFGVRWYWIVDPWLRSLQIHELDAQGRYVHVADATEGVVERIPGCEGLRIDLDALWREVESLGADEP